MSRISNLSDRAKIKLVTIGSIIGAITITALVLSTDSKLHPGTSPKFSTTQTVCIAGSNIKGVIVDEPRLNNTRNEWLYSVILTQGGKETFREQTLTICKH